MPALQTRNVVVVDSGPLLALFDRDDAHHARARQALQRNQGLRLLTIWPVLTETSALLSSRVGKGTEIEFLDWVAAGGVTVADLDHADLDAMIGLLRKCRELWVHTKSAKGRCGSTVRADRFQGWPVEGRLGEAGRHQGGVDTAEAVT